MPLLQTGGATGDEAGNKGAINVVMHARDCSLNEALEFITGERLSTKAPKPEESRRREERAVEARRAAQRREAEAARADRRRQERALDIWAQAVEPRRTLGEAYLRTRGVKIDDALAGEAIRFHPRCPWRDGEELLHVPALVALMRDIRTDAPVAIQRTRLTAAGQKVERRMLGFAKDAAIKLDADDTVLEGLHIGEGLETCMTARLYGLRPTWAVGSLGVIANFAVLDGIECLTLFEEFDGGKNAEACAVCADRWVRAGKQVFTQEPRAGLKDFNDAIRKDRQ